MELVEALRAEGAALAVVGAGGKKTTMYALAGRVPRAVVTATVRIPIFDAEVATLRVTDDPTAAVRGANRGAFPLGLVPERDRDDRYRGYEPETVDRLIRAHDGAVLIKADGARVRDFKAPNASEPRVPDAVDVVVPIVSAGVVGEPLTDELVHRPERVVRVARAAGVDAALGEPITPALIGAVLASPDGGCKGVPEGATVIPLVNKVDDPEREADGRAIADAIRSRLRDPRAVDDGSATDVNDGPAADVDVPHVVLGRLMDGAVVATVPV